jgi:hypothetical protein
MGPKTKPLWMPTHPYKTNIVVLSFGRKCYTIVKVKKPLVNYTKGLLGKNAQRLPYFKRKKLEVIVFRQ